MQLPVGNTTPNPPKNIRYVLNGVYFHRDANQWQYDPIDQSGRPTQPAGVLSPAQFIKYGVEKATEINIFFMGQNTYTQSPDTARWNYISGGASRFGYRANDNWMKVGNMWRHHLIKRVNDPNGNDVGLTEYMALTLNHETGHLLNLRHPYQQRQCADTPQNPTSNAGNNLMDYASQNALTPCQLDIAHQQMRTNYRAYSLCNDNCDPTHAFFTMPPCAMVTQSGGLWQSRDLAIDGRGSWVSRASATSASYRLYVYEADANGAMIAGTRSAIVTTAGEPGIIRLRTLFPSYSFQPNRRYGVNLAVNSSCYSHNTTQYFLTSTDGCQAADPQPRSASAAPAEPAATVALFPNPTATGEFSVRTAGTEPARVSVRDAYGRLVATERLTENGSEMAAEAGSRTGTYRLATSRPGLYLVEVVCGEQRTVRHLAVRQK